MTTGDGAAGGGAIPLPRRPDSGVPVPITLHSAARSATALMEAVVPPWLRAPTTACARPVVDGAGPAVDGARPPAAAPIPAVTPAPTWSTAATRRPPRAVGPDRRPPSARPRVEPEAGMIGLSRLTRSRAGSRLFTLFFVAVFALIFVQMCVVLLRG